MRIIGIKVKDGYASVIKNLKPGTWYAFGNYTEPTENNNWNWKNDEDNEDDDLLSEAYKASSDEPFPNNLRISVACIVGKNGSGKTTLLELMFRIINNFAYTILDKGTEKEDFAALSLKGRELCEATGFAASLFFETDGNLGIVDYDYGKVGYRYFTKSEKSRVEIVDFDKVTVSRSKKKKLLSDFFYTICTNYSIHSFCENDYSAETMTEPERGKEINGKWVSGLLHKNDGYLAPMVVVPNRDSWGNIDIANEKELAEQRLATLSILFWSQGKSFMEKYKPAYLEYRFDDESGNRFYEKFLSMCSEQLPLNEDPTDAIFEKLRLCWSEKLKEYDFFDTYGECVRNTILSYLIYKTVKICLTYISFGNVLGIRDLTDEEIITVKGRRREEGLYDGTRNPSYATLPEGWNEMIVRLILSHNEQTHITLKIRQVLTFLRRGFFTPTVAAKGTDTYLTSVKKIAVDRLIAKNLDFENACLQENRLKKKFTKYDEVFEILPPAFFEWRLYLLPKDEKVDCAMSNGLLMQQMSSGEKQMLQSASYLLYHIKNIESIREDKNREAYHHINLVLDEAELYYHPEMQRTMIANIVKMLSWCHINNTKIRSVHVMIVTHSPFVLSDVPKNRILYMNDGGNAKTDNQTFAANIHDLLYNQFFIENPIGEVAYSSVRKIVDMYNNPDCISIKEKNRFYSKISFYRGIIDLVGESYLHNTLTDMLDQIVMRISDDSAIRTERERLLKRLEQLDYLLNKK